MKELLANIMLSVKNINSLKYKHLFLLLIYTNLLAAQSFGSDNAEWVFDLNGFGEFGITKLMVVKDTAVNNQVYQAFYKEAVRNINGEVGTYIRSPFYIRTESGVVTYTGNFTFEDTLYNFDAVIGESWAHPKRNRDGDKTGLSLLYTVLDTFSIQLNDVPVFAQEVEIENSNTGFSAVDTLIQGIGSRLRFMLPFDWPPAAVDTGDRGVLRCFYSEDVGVVDFTPFHMALPYGNPLSDFEYACDALTDVENPNQEIKEISLYPNPANHHINILGNGVPLKNIAIYNCNGKFLKQLQIDNSTYQLDISSLSAGIYFLQINDMDFRKVIVIE